MPLRLFVSTSIFVFIVLFVSSVRTTAAASLELSNIGALSTDGKMYTQWWYTTSNPTLVGQADPSATVTIAIDSSSQTLTADSLGNWSYRPTTLTEGDHPVTITSNGQVIAFTLTIGENLPESFGGSSTIQNSSQSNPVASSSASKKMLVAGTATDTLLVLSTGASLIALGFVLKRIRQTHQVSYNTV